MRAPPANPFIDFARALAGFVSSTLGIFSTLFDYVAISVQRSQRKHEREAEIKRLSAHADMNELRAANAEISSVAGFPDLDHFLDNLMTRWAHDLDDQQLEFPIYSIRVPLLRAFANLYKVEGLHLAPPPAKTFASPIDEARYRDLLIERSKKATDPRTLSTIDRISRDILLNVTRLLPALALDRGDEQPATTTFSLLDLVRPEPLLDAIILPFFDPTAIDLGLFKSLRHQLQANADEFAASKAELGEKVSRLLAGTDFAKLFLVQTPSSYQMSKDTPVIGS